MPNTQFGWVVSFFGAVYKLPAAHIEEAVEALSLAPVLAKPVGTLSKGYRRRLLMACGLLTPHPLLVMDEPFDGFDLHQTREMMALLRRVTRRGRTLLLAIHQLTDAERICDRFVLLAAGRVRAEGKMAALRDKAGLPAGAGLEEVFLALT
jgi:ABC-type multidrug transport system ATPase subunit